MYVCEIKYYNELLTVLECPEHWYMNVCLHGKTGSDDDEDTFGRQVRCVS